MGSVAYIKDQRIKRLKAGSESLEATWREFKANYEKFEAYLTEQGREHRQGTEGRIDKMRGLQRKRRRLEKYRHLRNWQVE